MTNILITQSIINNRESMRRSELEAEERRHREEMEEQERRHRAEMTRTVVVERPRVTIIDDPFAPEYPRERSVAREEAIHASIDERPYYRRPATREIEGVDWGKVIKVLVVGFLIALVPVIIVFGIMNYKPPAPRYHGSFAAGNIHVVDSVANPPVDVVSHVSMFDVAVTNDTNNWDAHWWLGNTTTLSGVYSILENIPDSLYYDDALLYTTGDGVYGDSFDIVTTGETYVWLPAA